MSAQEENTPKVDGPEKTNEDGKAEQQKSTEEEIGKTFYIILIKRKMSFHG